MNPLINIVRRRGENLAIIVKVVEGFTVEVGADGLPVFRDWSGFSVIAESKTIRGLNWQDSGELTYWIKL